MNGVHRVRVIAVSGGKGGVGKTTVAVNLSLALARAGRRVVLLDADLGLASIDALLGLTPRYRLADVIAGRCELADALVRGPGGIRIAAASSGSPDMAHLQPTQFHALIHAFSSIGDELDVLVIDTAAGIGETVMSFLRAAQEVIVVACDEPAAIRGTCNLIQLLHQHYGIHRFRVLANKSANAREGRKLFAELEKVTDRLLDVHLHYLGAVPNDESVPRAVRKRQVVVEAYPRSRFANAFRDIAQKIDAWPLPAHPGGHVEFFVEQLVHNSRHGAPSPGDEVDA